MKQLVAKLTFMLLLLTATAAGAQDYEQQREELALKQAQARADIEQLDEQIARYQERLDLANQKLDSTWTRYENLERLIALQDERLNQLTTEQQHLNEEIAVIEEDLAAKQQEHDALVENYKETVRYIYKHGRTTELALLFSSRSWNQMLVRAHYLEKFETYREEQSNRIKETQTELENTRLELVSNQTRNEELLKEIRVEREELNESYQFQEQVVESIRNDIRQYEENKKQAEADIQEANRRITEYAEEDERLRLEEEERLRKLADAENIENPGEREREVARYSNPSSNLLNAEEMEAIEEGFSQLKGELPWPVASRTISTPFGRKRHPIYGTTTPSLGIEILTEPEEPVRAVHDGQVFAYSLFPGIGDVVLVKHGRFITAYGNLSEVLVGKNTILKAGDLIGYAGNENSTKGESVFFMVREDNTNLDPEQWLRSN